MVLLKAKVLIFPILLAQHVVQSAVTFGVDVPECSTLSTADDITANNFYMTIADLNTAFSAESNYEPYFHTGYDYGYYVSLLAGAGQTKECFFLIDATSTVFYNL